MTLRIIRVGSWLYGGSVDTPVDIVALDYDYWYKLGEADCALEPGETPEPLGQGGFLYYARFRHALETSEPTWPDSPGYSTIAQAVAHAESKVTGGIVWQDAVAA
ncbi:hypothetical protein FZO89_09490 [Luteimonas viscosa]|uniref:Uncharacterized protein n=1 Tax=Luteimonas viscosa TaxID=1132694 RepID=A0A5D4XUJ6_9GAMM|nr:hypothetical protein [Luteimonas viscosa]TYT26470.1 hypothetical protein FZO89_09490 [Luteimonas viscosa]